MFKIPSMIFVLHLHLFQTKIPCQCSTYHLWSSFFMFLSYRDKNRVLNIWHMMNDHRSLFCVLQIWIPCPYSLMFGRRSMISILHMCVFETSYRVLIVWHIIYDLPSVCLCLPELNSVLIVRPRFHLWTLLFLFVSSRNKYSAPNVRHIIYNHIFVYIRVLQR